MLRGTLHGMRYLALIGSAGITLAYRTLGVLGTIANLQIVQREGSCMICVLLGGEEMIDGIASMLQRFYLMCCRKYAFMTVDICLLSNNRHGGPVEREELGR